MVVHTGGRDVRRCSGWMLVAAAGLALTPGALARDAPSDPVPVRVLELRTGQVNTAERPNLLGAAAFDGALVYVVQLDGPMTPARRAALTGAGVELGQYLPSNAYIARLTNARPADLGALGFVAWVGVFSDQWKLDPAIGNRAYATAERQNLAGAGVSRVVVVLFDGTDARPAIAEITRLGGAVIDANPSGDGWLIDAEMRTADVPALGSLPSVQFVEDAPEGTFRNDSNRWILQSNVSAQTPVWNKGIHGEGQIGGLIDGTIRETHCMFDDTVAVGPTHRKIVAMRNASAADSHGTHTAGTMAGDATPFNAYTTGDGMAFAAKISFSNVNPVYTSPSTLQARFQDAHNDGARAHSNSWGDDGTQAYTTWCRQIDLFTYANEESMVAFAVSNGSVVTTPENSINVLGVAASLDSPSQGSHCTGGTGLTIDGRRKPEVFAPGCSTVSASSATTCGTTAMTGTSMACPAVTGAGLLVRQYFTEGWYPTGTKVPANSLTPSGALLRAMLINSAVDMTGIAGFPSNQEGWGRVLLDNATFFAGDARKLVAQDVRNPQGLSTGQATTYYLTVNTNAQPLEITLVFTAPAAAVNAANPVINNLNLEVTDPAATLYRGNVFTSGQSSTGGTADAKNNVEVVLRTAPTPGVYAVTIRGAAVNSGTQGYALVVTGDVASGCATPTITTPPAPLTVHVNDPATFTVAASGTAPLAYQWKKGGADIGGATAISYTISSAALTDAADYSVAVTSPCGTTLSTSAALTVLCPSDYNGDGFVDGIDYDQFNNDFESPDPVQQLFADFNGDGFVDGIDYDLFNNAFEGGC